MPWFVWILIIYLGYEDVIKIAQSYWIIPVILLFSGYGVLNVMGMGHIPQTFFNILSTTVRGMLKK
jgi:hypothetical protein